MKVLRIRTLAGPNIYSHQSALLMRLEVEAGDERFLSEYADFSQRLEVFNIKPPSSIPGMRKIRTASNPIAEAVRDAALGLIKLAGFGTPGAVIRFSGDPGVYEIAVEYDDERAARFLLESAVEAIEAIQKNQTFDVSDVVSRARRLAADKSKGDALSPPVQRRKIPVVAVTGTNGKTTVTRLIAYALRQTGLNIGTTTTGGILLNGEVIEAGDTTGPASARKILENPAVDVAVLETARGGIMRRGLGWDWADVAVVTNVTEDHIGQDGIESVADLVDVKSLVAERVRVGGTLALNADDTESAALAVRPAVLRIEKEIVYFAMREDNPILERHAEAGGTVYFVQENWICERRGEATARIAETTKIPITIGGTADYQIQNAMAAIAVCRAFDLSFERIAVGLYGFQNAADNPGRNNLYRVGEGYVLVDYGHNTDGFAAVSRMASRWNGKTVTAIIGLPGDRADRVIEEAAQVAARGFDKVIVTEEVNPRGRAPGEMAKLLSDAIKREKPDSDCEIVPDEIEAFSEALARMQKNEVVVMFYRQLNLILEILAEKGAVPVSSFEETAAPN